MYFYNGNDHPPPKLLLESHTFGKCFAPGMINFFIAKNAHILKPPLKKINAVHDLITISIVFTNKNGMDRFNPPPPSEIWIRTPHQK